MTPAELVAATGAVPIGAPCPVEGCREVAVVQWCRRLTAAEAEEAALPTAEGSVRAVYACGPHAIDMNLASLVHAAVCSAPVVALLPGCTCTPEPLPAQSPPAAEATITLSTGWVVPKPTPSEA